MGPAMGGPRAGLIGFSHFMDWQAARPLDDASCNPALDGRTLEAPDNGKVSLLLPLLTVGNQLSIA